jgi:hypothetical protein
VVQLRSGPGAVRTILLFHIFSAGPSKQTLMVRTFIKVLYYFWQFLIMAVGLIFISFGRRARWN